jgi:hypothetical protein
MEESDLSGVGADEGTFPLAESRILHSKLIWLLFEMSGCEGDRR